MISVLNHHTREVEELEKKLSDLGLEYKVFTDTSDYNTKRGDVRNTGVSMNYLKIIDACEEEWNIIIHDDISVSDDLFKKIEHVLKFTPKTAISFYNPTNEGYRKCVSSGNHILKTYSNWWTQCHAVHKRFAIEFSKWCRNHVKPLGYLAEDSMLWRFCSYTDVPAFAVVPGLVQHEGFNRSTLRNPWRVGKYARDSATYSPTFDVFSVDWEKEFSHPYLDNQKKKDGLHIEL